MILSRFKILLLCFLPLGVLAQIPRSLHHQGRIAVNSVNFDGSGQFKFLLYHGKNPTDTTTLVWANDNSSPTAVEPTSALTLPVTKGLYSVHLGDSPQQPITGNLVPASNNESLFLRIWFNDGVNGFQLLSPDRKITGVPFALHGGSGGGGTSSGLPQSGTVTVTPDATDFSRANFEVTFPSPFATTPIVTASTVSGSSMFASGLGAQILSVSPNGFAGTVGPLQTEAITRATDRDPPTRPDERVGRYLTSDWVGNKPIVAYVNESTLRRDIVVESTVDGGTSWDFEMVVIDGVPSEYAHLDAAIIAGRSAVIYRVEGAGQKELHFAIKIGSPTARTGIIATDTSNSPSTFRHTEIADIAGRPGIAYRLSNTGLFYRHGNTATGIINDSFGADFAPAVNVDPTTSPMIGISLHEVNGHPAISYLIPGATTELRYVRALDPTGSTWGTPVSLGTAIASNSVLKIINGHPTIFAKDQMFRALDVNGTAFAPPVTTISQTQKPSGEISVTIVNGHPALTFFNNTSGLLYYTRAADANGSTWFTPTPLDTIGDNGEFHTLTMAGTSPLALFRRGESGSGELRQIRPLEPSLTINWIAIEP